MTQKPARASLDTEYVGPVRGGYLGGKIFRKRKREW